jgi:hypothetical protein
VTDPDASELINNVGRALWESVLVGDPAPAVAELRNRMKRPRPGDLVIEVTMLGRFDPDSVGRLLRVEGDNPGLPDRYVVEPLHRPGEEQGWRNAQFIALPDQRASTRWASSEE